MKIVKNCRTAARIVFWAALAADLVVLPLASQAAAYFYTDLTPSGSIECAGLGISGGQQVGSACCPATEGLLPATDAVNPAQVNTCGRPRYVHALLWSGSASNVVDLHPSGFTSSEATGASGGQQAGYGFALGAVVGLHALLWSGTASSVVDLHPSGFNESVANGISGSQQVGWGRDYALFNGHALLWSGTASSVVDLHPSGFVNSEANGTSGSQQVGDGFGAPISNLRHALLWSGTAASVVDLHPSGFTQTIATGISGNQQVGYGFGPATRFDHHALLWSGTAASVVDLNSSGLIASEAYGTSGSQQVGAGFGPATRGADHALLWSGTANSVVDLGSMLSSGYATCSQASGTDANGKVIGYAQHFPDGAYHAILWTVVRERAVIGNDPGQCGAVFTYSTDLSNATCSPPSGSFFPVGSTTVTCTSTNPPSMFTFTVTVEDREAPLAACWPAPNPSGKKIPPAGKNGNSGQNPDGYYQLLSKDNCDANPTLFVADSASGYVVGPFPSGDIVKITQNPGGTPDQQPGAQNVVAHIHLNGDALVYAVDAAGNVGASVWCEVP